MILPRYKIAEGIHASSLATDKFKVNAITLSLKAPVTLESITMLNLLSRVLSRGCEAYPDIKSIESRLDTLYGADLDMNISRRGDSQYLCASVDFLSRKYTEDCDIIEGAVDILTKVLLCPALENGGFIQNYVDGEKKNLADAINGLINNKARYAKLRCTEEMCSGEPFALPPLGDKSLLEAITPVSLYNFYKELIATSKIEILYTGTERFFSSVCENFSNAFGKVERSYSESCDAPQKHIHREYKELCEDMEVNQGKLSVGLTTDIVGPSDELPALIVANEIFGSSPNSKLFMNVREKMSLCYYCSSSLDASKGLMFVNAGIENENFERTRDAIFAQLDALKSGDFTDEELDNAIISLTNGYSSIPDSITALEAWYIPRIFRGDSETVEERIAKIKKVTREDITAVAAKINADIVYFLRGSLNGGGDEDDN